MSDSGLRCAPPSCPTTLAVSVAHCAVSRIVCVCFALGSFYDSCSSATWLRADKSTLPVLERPRLENVTAHSKRKREPPPCVSLSKGGTQPPPFRPSDLNTKKQQNRRTQTGHLKLKKEAKRAFKLLSIRPSFETSACHSHSLHRQTTGVMLFGWLFAGQSLDRNSSPARQPQCNSYCPLPGTRPVTATVISF